ncbi:NADH dehydrogenase [ubiquinone] iron-sulfur protein 6, mitochondrial-like [Eriocheir sinensis]|uniref:NADH dehydrogenase [ubiquinone] iron-sulfur protein 6, mitochondrial-like n=1 Tax=Eriocheir sinensis TaxID=95602 RepID=UPI0021C85680|nr:NADH dehydrogenase [ubiquinone] iron-sulfur protein 6, mitochondrial-like [Eriocheir sinensis]
MKMAALYRTVLSAPRSSLSRCVCAAPQPLTAALHTSAPAQDSSPTHTGQVLEPDDPRNARFLVTPRQTNPRWAINLIQEVPPKAVNTRVVACDGGPGALGHPRVYINLDDAGNHACIYCGLRYTKEG